MHTSSHNYSKYKTTKSQFALRVSEYVCDGMTPVTHIHNPMSIQPSNDKMSY